MKWFARLVAAVCCLVLISFAPGWAQPSQSQQPPLPFAPEWALIAGWDVYAKKGCGQCHGVRSGSEGRAAPDLARIQSGAGFYELGAAMWNHLPLIGAKMREKGIERPDPHAAGTGKRARVHLHRAVQRRAPEREDRRAAVHDEAVRAVSQVAGKGGNVGPAPSSARTRPCWWRRVCGVTGPGSPRRCGPRGSSVRRS